MGIVTLRPNGVALASNIAAYAGAGTTDVRLADDSDSTEVKGGHVGPGSVLILDMGTTTIASGTYVRRVRSRFRGMREGFPSDGRNLLFLDVHVRSFYGEGPPDPYRGLFDSLVTYTGAWQNKTPRGTPWTQDIIDDIQLQFYLIGDGYASYYAVVFAEGYIDLDINSFPTCTPSLPTGTVTNTTRPDVVFQFNDADNDKLALYRVKIFDSTTYMAGGFDPETSDPIYDSENVRLSSIAGLNVTHKLPSSVNLDNLVTFRAYVLVYQDADLKPAESWAYTEFDLNITNPPAAPTLTATADDANARITLVATVQTDIYGDHDIWVERLDGTKWNRVRGALASGATDGVPVTFYDYEAPTGVVTSYRARTSVVSGDFVIGSAYSSTETAESDPSCSTGWVLKDPYDPTLNICLDVVDVTWDTEQLEEQAVYHPLGRKLPVVISDVIHGFDGTLVTQTLTKNDQDDFLAIRAAQHTLLLQRLQTDEQKYIRLSNQLSIKEGNTSPILYENTIQYVEVEVPTDVS